MFEELWCFHGRGEIEVESPAPDCFEISAESYSVGYVIGPEQNSNFSILPEYSFVDFEAGDTLSVRAEAVTDSSIEGQFVIVTYSADGSRSNTWGSASFVEAKTDSTTIRASLAFRIKGIGKINIHNVRVATSRSNLSDPIGIKTEVSEGQTVILSSAIFSTVQKSKASALVACQFYDESGGVVPPVANSPINPNIGSYYYATINELGDQEPASYSFDVPVGSFTASLQILPWNAAESLRVITTPTVTLSEIDSGSFVSVMETIDNFVKSVPTNDSLIIQHTTAPILGHPSLLLRPNRLAKEFTDLGSRVIFLPFSRVDGGSKLVNEKTLMVSREHWPVLQRVLGTRVGKNNVFICSSFPDNTAVAVADYLTLKNWTVIYEVRDDMEEFNRVGYSKWFNPLLERRMALLAHRIITVSPRLTDKMNIVSNRNDAITIPNAVAQQLIEMGSVARGTVAEEARSHSKVVGYLGHLTPSWFDWQLVIDSAEQRPEYEFQIIGHGMPDDLVLPANVIYLGPKSHQEFMEIAVTWRVGIIPFKPSTLTFAVDPNKLYEYLAVGLRVVSAQMGSVDTAPATFVYKSNDDFNIKLDSAMNLKFDEQDINDIEKYLDGSNWTKRALTMLDVFKDTFND